MRKKWTIFLQVASFLILSLAGDIAFAKKPTQLDLNLGIGYRIDHLNWNIGVENVINILSELTWDDLRIQQVKGGGRLTIKDIIPTYALYIRGSAGYGQIVEGENQDSDFDPNNPTNEVSRSNNDANDGNVLDASFGIGLQYSTMLKRSGWVLGIVPLVGYSYHEQNLTMTNGFQTIPALGPFPSDQILNSSYDAMWYGPWIGLDLSLETGNKVTIFGTFEYHWATYHAEANWNLRSDFAHPISFENDANGSGLVVLVGWEYLFFPDLAISVALEYLSWSTEAGRERTFLSESGFKKFGVRQIDQRLNEVNWESKSFTLGLVYRFN
ncbi:hypothetical protein JYT87_00980 [Nitrospira defluvii]|nr:hypothetical protein [Nitrospira defluvii]